MSWTDERIATLTKMWEGGATASQIADELGGVSRNGNILGATRDDEWTGDLPSDAPVVRVRAFAYKGIVEARTTPKR